MNHMKRILCFFLAVICIAGCKSVNKKNLLPNISGKAGEVLVVAERFQWDNMLKDCVQASLCADVPYLPMKEPMYNVITVTPSNFSQMFQIHRNIILFNVNAGVNNPGVVYSYDRWAKPQIVITVNAASPEEATELFNANIETIMTAIEQKERDRIIANTRAYQERKLATVVKDFIGGDMVFPSGYSLKKRSDNFLWISYETTYIQQGFMIYYYPAEGKGQFTADAIVAQRNKILKKEVPGMVEGSYMTTSDYIQPMVKYGSYKGISFAELHALWDVEGDFMGGPFVSHSFYTPDKLNVVCIEAYVYAPKFDKRHYLRQVESLIYGFQWPEEEEEK